MIRGPGRHALRGLSLGLECFRSDAQDAGSLIESVKLSHDDCPSERDEPVLSCSPKANVSYAGAVPRITNSTTGRRP